MNVLKLHLIIHSSIILLHYNYVRAVENVEPWIPLTHECEMWEEQCSGTIREFSHFNVTEDVEELNSALDTKNYFPLINILTRRSLNQRLLIAETYRARYGSDLNMTVANAERNFKNIVLALMKPLDIFYANELKEAMKSKVNKHLKMLDILGPLSNKGNKAVAEAFTADTNKSVSHYLCTILDMKDEHFYLFQTLSLGARNEGTSVNTTLVAQDVVKLQNAKINHSLEHDMVYMLMQHNNVQLRALYKVFFQEGKNQLEKRLCKGYLKYRNELRSSLCAMFRISQNRAKYFAKRLHSALKRPFIIEHEIVRRIFVGRSEIDLENIKRAYNAKYGTTLIDRIKDKASDLYQLVLLKLLQRPVYSPSPSGSAANLDHTQN